MSGKADRLTRALAARPLHNLGEGLRVSDAGCGISYWRGRGRAGGFCCVDLVLFSRAVPVHRAGARSWAARSL